MTTRQTLQSGGVELNDLSGGNHITIYNHIDYNFRFIKVVATDQIGVQNDIGHLDDIVTKVKQVMGSGNSEPEVSYKFFTFKEILIEKNVTKISKLYEYYLIEDPLFSLLSENPIKFKSEDGHQKNPSDIIKKLFKDGGYELSVGDTSKIEKINFIPPLTWTLSDCVAHLLKYCTSASGKSAFRLFPTGEKKLIFDSLPSLLKKSNKVVYKFLPDQPTPNQPNLKKKEIPPDPSDINISEKWILGYWIDIGDRYTLKKDGEGKTALTYDYMTGEHKEKKFSREAMLKDISSKGKDLYKEVEIFADYTRSFIEDDEKALDVVNDMQNALIDPLVLHTISFHDSETEIGTTAELEIFTIEDGKQEIDEKLSGTWLLAGMETTFRGVSVLDKLTWIRATIS